MNTVTIYHNPRCSKSRQTLALLEERGLKPHIIEYLNEPPDLATLQALVAQLGVSPREIIRDREYGELALPDTDDAEELLARIAEHPQILQRPIVVADGQAKLGRPPENVLEIL